MILDKSKVEETISDINSLKDRILERHIDDASLSLRISSVLTQLSNSLQ